MTLLKKLVKMSKSTKEHKKSSSSDISCTVITLSDSRKDKTEDPSGNYMVKLIEEKYKLNSRFIIPDEKDSLVKSIEEAIENDSDVILTTGGTGLDERDITVETVESLFDKKLHGFGEIFRLKSYEEIGASAILSRATAGVYKKKLIFSMPGSPNAVKTAMDIIIDELPHLVHHANK